MYVVHVQEQVGGQNGGWEINVQEKVGNFSDPQIFVDARCPKIGWSEPVILDGPGCVPEWAGHKFQLRVAHPVESLIIPTIGRIELRTAK